MPAPLRPYRRAGEDQCVTMLYCRPERPVRLDVEPQLASWDRAGSTGQVKLGHFLNHAEAMAAPMMAAVDGPLAVELTVGLPGQLPLTGGGRDLDNYLFPLAQRLGPARIAAMFGRKVHGESFLAVGQAKPDRVESLPQFSGQIAGSYVHTEWKMTVHDQILQTQGAVPAAGPISLTIDITTGPGRNWANIWKPLIDAFGPVLGEDPEQPFHPNDDRITTLGLHHHVNTGIGHDTIITAWWMNP
jgi:hypothetical protein